MATTVYATWSDITGNFEGTIPDSQRTRVEGFIRRASIKLNAIAPWLPDKFAAGQVDPEIPLGIVVEAVLRLFRNPEGLSTQIAGPFSKTYGGGANGQHDGLYIDAAEVHTLLDPFLTNAAGVGTFRVAHGGPVSPLEALKLAGGYDATPSEIESLLERYRRFG